MRHWEDSVLRSKRLTAETPELRIRPERQILQNVGPSFWSLRSHGRFRHLGVSAIILISLAAWAHALDYYVSTSGNDASAGTLAQPWRTISRAVSSASPVTAGDRIYVRAGTYAEYIQIEKSGSSGNPIQLLAYPGDARPVLTGGGPFGNISVFNQTNWTVAGFEIRDSNGGAGIYFDGGGSSNSVWTIRDNIIHNTDSGDNASCIFIQRNLGRFIIRDNILYDCDGTNPGNTTGIVIFGHINPGSPGTIDFTIQNNEIYNEGVGIKIKHPFAADQTINVDISYNLMHHLNHKGGVSTAGGQFISTKTNRIHHNIIHTSPATPGIEIGDDFDEHGVEVDHNTLYNTTTGLTICLADNCSDGGSLNHNVHDNIFAPTPRSGTSGYGIWTEMTSTPFTTSDYNCFWNVSPTLDVANWGGYGGGIAQSLNQWQSHGYDIHSALADPAFVNIAAGNFRLQTGSTCKNLRGTGRDPGAYETGSEMIGPSGIAPPPPSGSVCDLNNDSSTNVSDVQLCANQAIGVIGCTTGDINHDTSCNVVDVQRVVNAALGGQCVTQ
jgi:hypothetical protein